MFVIISGASDNITGPFETAEEAAKWAEEQVPLAKWRIAKLRPPSE